MQHRPTEDELEELLNSLDDNKTWELTDYSESSGKYEATTLTVELEYIKPLNRAVADGDSLKRIVMKEVRRLETTHESGADQNVVVENVVEEYEEEKEDVENVIENLRRLGEVYEPTKGHLRAT